MSIQMECSVQEDRSKLVILEGAKPQLNLDAALFALRNDQVVMIRNVSPENSDASIGAVARSLGLLDQLSVQSAYASIQGHRSNVSTHFMSVNKRMDYQFIPAHSEGQHSFNMQLACIYCHENSTDGGHSILMNTDSESNAWPRLRELVKCVDLGGRTVSPAEAIKARSLLQINIPEDVLRPDHEIVDELPVPVPGIRLYRALIAPRRCHSKILNRNVYVYWDSIASIDHTSADEYSRLLKTLGLLKTPPGGADLATLDNSHPRRIWSSGVTYREIFKSRINLPIDAGDLVIFNNLTWTHSASNWTPDSGSRRAVVAFA